MAFDLAAPMQRLKTVLEGLAIVPPLQVVIGAPLSLPTRVSAYLLLHTPTINDKSGQLLQLSQQYYIGIGYRVSGESEASELALAAVLSAFYVAFYQDRKLAGTVASASLDLSGQRAESAYQDWQGKEHRIAPVIVTVTLQSNP